MKACLANSTGLVANVSADSIQLIGYSEDFIDIVGATPDEYTISSTMIICESVAGLALIDLKASIQRKSYDLVLSNCLGTSVNLVAGSFALALPTTLPT